MLAGTTCSSPAEIYNYVRTMGLFVYAMYMSCMCHACALHGYLNCHKRTVLSLCIYLSHSVSLSVSTLLSVVITLIQYLASAHYSHCIVSRRAKQAFHREGRRRQVQNDAFVSSWDYRTAGHTSVPADPAQVIPSSTRT